MNEVVDDNIQNGKIEMRTEIEVILSEILLLMTINSLCNIKLVFKTVVIGSNWYMHNPSLKLWSAFS